MGKPLKKANDQNKVGATPTVEVTVQEGSVAVATDNIPEGEPMENEDGSVIAYDENGEVVGTVSAEDVEKAEQSVTEVVVESPDESAAVEKTSPSVVVQGKPDEKTRPKENVKIRLRKDHSCSIGGEMYDFKAGKVYTVPKNVKKILNRAGFLSPL